MNRKLRKNLASFLHYIFIFIAAVICWKIIIKSSRKLSEPNISQRAREGEREREKVMDLVMSYQRRLLDFLTYASHQRQHRTTWKYHIYICYIICVAWCVLRRICESASILCCIAFGDQKIQVTQSERHLKQTHFIFSIHIDACHMHAYTLTETEAVCHSHCWQFRRNSSPTATLNSCAIKYEIKWDRPPPHVQAFIR